MAKPKRDSSTDPHAPLPEGAERQPGAAFDREGPAVRGQAVLRPLADVVANPWNPNRMTDHMFRSVVHGLRADGWVASQALLVWGTDEKGRTRNMIIDGEHRWRAAREAGFVEGPMVLLDGVTEAEAKALTVKLNQKRGDWNDELLGTLLRELAEAGPPGADLSTDLGIQEEDLMRLLAEPPPAQPATPAGAAAVLPEAPPGEAAPAAQPDSGVRMVQLYLNAGSHPPFMADVKAVADAWKIDNVTDTVREAMRRAAEQVRATTSA